jgi:LuxR family maltose regulon positive regulatory protein
MTESDFTLKATPPRMPRGAIERERLRTFWDEAHECTALLVVASAGFGKTTLLQQWRRRWLETGAAVAWLSADDRDDPTRFTLALLHALRAASALPALDALDAKPPANMPGAEALTAALAEIAFRGVQTVLVIDDAERLPEATVRGILQYLLLNAPANLHVAIGSRTRLPLHTAELVSKGNYAKLGTDDLRLRLEESLAIVERRLGDQLGVDERAQLHDVTEGWAIGLQLAIATIEHEPDLSAAIRSLSARRGTLQDYFVESLLTRLPPRLAGFLTRISILDDINGELCEAITGCEDARAQLDRLIGDTPIMMVGENGDWLRLHPLARDFLLGRFEQLPIVEQAELHRRASHWYAQHERFHQAARHALASGDEPMAQQYAAKALWSLGTGGQIEEAREWIERLPPEMFTSDAQLQLVAASILALGDRNAEALAIARTLLRQGDLAPGALPVALRVAAGAATFADQLGLLPELIARWPAAGTPDANLFAVSCLNTRAVMALHAGETGEVRTLIGHAAAHGHGESMRLAHAHGRMLVGLSLLWDGRPDEAEADLRPVLARFERDEGRRSYLACLFASVVAPALVDRNQPAAAQALLANRLDVIERCGFPDNLLCAYRALARAALRQGDERRALSVLGNLDALAMHRQLPRLRLYALAEQLRIHAGRECHETLDRLLVDIDAMLPLFESDELRPLRSECQLVAATARAHAALARADYQEAEAQLRLAHAAATSIHRGRDVVQLKALRALVAWRQDSARAVPLLREALALARIAGNIRLVTDSHPLAADMLAQLGEAVGLGTAPPPPSMPTQQPPVASAAAVRKQMLPRSALLTSKEAEILRLLGKGMSNKLIARTLDISNETVKWHLKNLYLKLSAGTRKHAVDRARLLGLVH